MGVTVGKIMLKGRFVEYGAMSIAIKTISYNYYKLYAIAIEHTGNKIRIDKRDMTSFKCH